MTPCSLGDCSQYYGRLYSRHLQGKFGNHLQDYVIIQEITITNLTAARTSDIKLSQVSEFNRTENTSQETTKVVALSAQGSYNKLKYY